MKKYIIEHVPSWSDKRKIEELNNKINEINSKIKELTDTMVNLSKEKLELNYGVKIGDIVKRDSLKLDVKDHVVYFPPDDGLITPSTLTKLYIARLNNDTKTIKTKPRRMLANEFETFYKTGVNVNNPEKLTKDLEPNRKETEEDILNSKIKIKAKRRKRVQNKK